jgi:hypothetical protein
MGACPGEAVREFEAAMQAEARQHQPDPSLLERLQASLAARQGAEAAPEDAEALAAIQARQAAAWAHLRDFVSWVDQGSDVMARLWDAVPDADSVGLCDLLRMLTNREAGLMGALALFQRHVENALGERHGRVAIMDGDAVAGAVERQAASTKWDVDDAWPEVGRAIRKAERLPIGDPEDGELEDDTAKTLRLVRDLCGISYLKVGTCEQLGIDPDEYRTKSGYRWVVKLP